jgi:hypothetical protein
MRAREFIIEDQPDNPDSWESQAADAERDAETVRMADQDAEAGGVAEAKRKKKSSRSMGGYFFPGYGYYGSGDSGEGGGDGGGESVNRGMSEEGMEEDITRRGFLKGAGAAAVAGAAGVSAAKAQSFDAPGATADEIAQGKYIRPYLGFIRKVVNPLVRVDNSQPTDNLKTTIVLTWNTQNGNILDIQASDNSPWSQAVLNAFNQAFPTKQLPKGWELTGAPQRPSYKMILNFTPQQVYGTNESVEQGVAEGDLNEKSTSQAQFRTMAAAAHNPKFAKKVGISPDVAKEFHGADRKQNYKSLPKKAAEDASWGMAPESKGYRK